MASRKKNKKNKAKGKIKKNKKVKKNYLSLKKPKKSKKEFKEKVKKKTEKRVKKNKNKKIKKKTSKKQISSKKNNNLTSINHKNSPVLLMIMDGFGIRNSKKGNAVKLAKMPFYNSLLEDYPHSKLYASEKYVGLPKKQMGNSEVGHMTIGSGRIIDTDLVHINKKIKNKKFFKNKVLIEAMAKTKKNKAALHLMGLLSDGGIHSHIAHVFAILKLAKKHKVENVYIHCFLDGRDTLPKAAAKYINQLQDFCRKNKIGKIASLIGRFYAMDRDNRWRRENKAYSLMVSGIGRKFLHKPIDALRFAYKEGETDEFVKPILIDKQGLVKNNDTLIFFNFRSDRAREITKAFTLKSFNNFKRNFVKTNFYCLTMYDRHFTLPVAFPPRIPQNTLGEVIAKNNLKQLRTAETEKYPHVTFFFNGGIETPNKNEDRILVPSPKVLTYDLKPEMSAPIVAEKLVTALKRKKYDFIVLNFANPDMVGHAGSLKAVKKALEDLDPLIEQITNEILLQNGTVLLIADHGNCEKMIQNNKPHTAHTLNRVPCIIINNKSRFKNISDKRNNSSYIKDGSLKDVAPTILDLFDIKKSDEMTGHTLIKYELAKRLKH